MSACACSSGRPARGCARAMAGGAVARTRSRRQKAVVSLLRRARGDLPSPCVVWQRRPDSRIGVLLTVATFAWLAQRAGDGAPRLRRSPLRSATRRFGLECGDLLVHVILAYPTGRLGDRRGRGFVAAAYVLRGRAPPFATLLVVPDPRAPQDDPDVLGVPRARPLTHVGWLGRLPSLHDVLDRYLLHPAGCGLPGRCSSGSSSARLRARDGSCCPLAVVALLRGGSSYAAPGRPLARGFHSYSFWSSAA